MHRVSSKRVLAVALAFALLLCCLPATYAMADDFTSVNLLTGAESKVDFANSTPVYYDKYLTESAFASAYGLSSSTVSGLVDGNTSTEYLFNGRGTTSRLWNGVRYALTESCFAQKLVIYSGLPALVDCYDVYASDDLDTLYRVGNYMGKFTCSGDAVEIPLNKSVQYFAVIYDQPTSNNESARPREIELWSGDETDTFAPVCLTDPTLNKLADYSCVTLDPSTMATSTRVLGNKSGVPMLEYFATNMTNSHADVSQSGSNYTTFQYGFDTMYYIGDICIDAGTWGCDETWDVYASNNLVDLYSEESKVATVECKYASGARLTLNTYATYVALSQTTGYARIRALRIYTADSTGVPMPFISENIMTTDVNSITPVIMNISSGAVSAHNQFNSAGAVATLNDGNRANTVDAYGANDWGYNSGVLVEFNESAYCGSVSIFSGSAVNPDTYRVYASNSIETLYSEQSKVSDGVICTGTEQSLEVGRTIKYLALFLTEYNGNGRIAEIEAWTAEAPAAPVVFTPENVLANNVASSRCVQFYPTSHYVGDASQINAETIGYLTDGNTTDTHDCATALDWNPPRYLGVEYTLDDTYFVGSLKIYSGYTTSIDTFDVYASDDLGTLYDDANRVAYRLNCDNTGAQTITINKNVKYVTFLISGIELYCARIAEFEAWTADEAEVAAPAFGSHSLVLTDAIGVNFFMNLDALTAEEKAASYVTFDIKNGERKTVSFDGDFTGNGGTYGFTCFVSSVQMAEAITPTFHYGDKTTLAGVSYSVKDYIDYVNANSGSFAAEVVTLVKAIGDYGHYAQDYLGTKNGWTAGEDYTALAKYRAADYGSDDYSSAANELSENGKVASPTGTASGAAAGQYQFALNFDSTTSLVIKINNNGAATANSDYDGSVERDAADGSLLFYLLKMPVTKLGNIYSVSGSIDSNPYSINICGLSYVYGIINSGSASDAAKKAVCSLYDYYKAAIAYQATLS